MYRRALIVVISSMVLCSLITGCIPFVLPWNFPESEISFWRQNKFIKVYAPSGWNTYLIGDPVVVAIENISNKRVRYYDYTGNSIYFWNGEEWTKTIDDAINETPSGYELAPKYDEFGKIGSLMFFPKIDNESEYIYLLVVCEAEVIDYTGNNERTSGYTVIKIHNSRDYQK